MYIYICVCVCVCVCVCDVCKLLRHFNDISMIFILQLSDRTLTTHTNTTVTPYDLKA